MAVYCDGTQQRGEGRRWGARGAVDSWVMIQMALDDDVVRIEKMETPGSCERVLYERRYVFDEGWVGTGRIGGGSLPWAWATWIDLEGVNVYAYDAIESLLMVTDPEFQFGSVGRCCLYPGPSHEPNMAWATKVPWLAQDVSMALCCWMALASQHSQTSF
ncbi:unnamed protein product [Sphenostylis stenocarpa]|uniref:Uncharacterized protein n=1 Tax=Sphenostylis stenocarpa TaxID=92480 RepID=A0AA86S0L7_9FABA|nr:unnamed protein product [Sphenostylis stenocarpa]